ncbi:MAG: radical SAM family heme chaperone HemW [Chloroflexota bacterium]
MTDPFAPLSIYLHVPFCVHRCAYCDFNTYAGQQASLPAYVDALLREIGFVGVGDGDERKDVHTIFFGGGTPSLLSPPQLASVIDALRAAFALSPDLEVTLEANPGTTSPDYLHRLRAIGINRLSYGVQSAEPGELRLLERAHDFFDVIASVKWARQAGFDNLNLDLIYGLPEQTLADWQTSLRRALDLHPEHLSLYALTLEHGTPFGRWAARGLLPTPDPDLAAEMYEWAGEYLQAHGYVQYEISNWARMNSGFMCRHNLQYWRGLSYLGLGAGAHGYANGYRYANALRIKTYIERLSADQFPMPNYQFPLTSAVVNHHRQTPQDDMSEFMLNGLRLTREGVSPETFHARFGRDLRAVFGREIEELLRLGLLEWAEIQTSEVSRTSEVLRLTVRGRLLGNQVFLRFV